ncbi:ATP-binding protein [Desulfosarcina ovata]|uniref:Histidine kinase/HSP90-like ATPase domain-containing protein n=1 Tax=Desulfosarcina ovata subsp. ovata TaxID=2752305 RepID=A0A5K8AFR3_9BACT|nr:ATP-binding protein [Desulfosarcina ovata]BBO91336.1 hypothetical protein DSCOOX_45160 [Desulfosarcina ovata subsp. ovata]
MHRPEAPPASVTARARLENLPRWIAPVLAVSRSLAMDEERCLHLELALEECLVNIITHAYPHTAGLIQVDCRVETAHLVVEISDQGIAFDMTQAPDADLSPDIERRRIGGLGVHLVRRLMDEVHYRREGNHNRLQLRLGIHPGETP